MGCLYSNARLLAVLAGLWLLLPATALAQAGNAMASDDVYRTPVEATSSGRFMRFIGSHDFQKRLYDVGVLWDRDRGALCPDGQHNVQTLGLTEILQPLTFPAVAATPVSGNFIIGFRLTRCGRSINYKVLVGLSPDGQYKVIPWMPGDSAINYQLFRDALPGVISIASADNAGCKQIMVLDTAAAVVVESNLPAYGGAKGERRRERWWLIACGKQVALDFDTIPHPSMPGLSYAVKPVADAPAPALR